MSMRTPADTTCWRSIGVQGDRSCPELAQHVHCRNCPTYTGAARHSLARELDADYGEEWARVLAKPADSVASTDAAAMVFRIGAEWLAVPLALASSVAPIAAVHRVPHRSGGALLGLVAADGRLLPAVSLAHLLDIGADGAPAAAPRVAGRHAFPRLLVLAEPRGPHGAPAFALPVDEVQGVVRHATASLQPPAATVGRAPPPLVQGVLATGLDGVQAGLLDARRLMTALTGLLR